MKALVADNFRFLTWLIFQPLTLRAWLLEVAPEMEPGASAWKMWKASRDNPELRWFLYHLITQLFLIIPLSAGVSLICAGTLWGYRTESLIHLWLAAGGIWVAISILVSVFGSLVQSAIQSVTFAVTGALALAVVLHLADNSALTAANLDVAKGAVLGVTLGVSRSAWERITLEEPESGIRGVTRKVFEGVGLGLYFSMSGRAPLGIAFSLSYFSSLLRVVVWLPEQIWLLWLRVCCQVGWMSAPTALAVSPHRFDGLIHLPLLGLQGLLIEVGRRSPLEILRAVVSMQTSPGLRMIAQQAAIEIQPYLLLQPRNLPTLLSLSEDPLFVSRLLPASQKDVLISFQSVAQTLRSGLLAQNGPLRLNACERATKRLEGLERAITLSDEPLTRLYLPAIAHWQKVIGETAQGLRASQTEAREVLSPFYAGLPLGPREIKQLLGREDDLRWLEHHLGDHRPDPIFLSGAGRVGKSSLLRCLPSLLGERYLPIWVDCQGVAAFQSSASIYEFISREIVAQAGFASRSLTLPLPDRGSFENEPSLAFRGLLDATRDTLGERRLLLCLDEIPEIDGLMSRSVLDETFLATLRNLAQQEPWLRLIFAGRRRLSELPDVWAIYFNHVAQHGLKSIDRVAAEALLTRPTDEPSEFPITYSPEALETLLDVTGGQPFLVQAVGDTLVHHLNDARRRCFTMEDVDPVLTAVLEVHETVFKDWSIDYGGRGERRIMDHLAEAGPTEKAALLNDPGEGGADPHTLKRALKRLLRDDLILEDAGVLRIRADLIRRYWEEEVVGSPVRD